MMSIIRVEDIRLIVPWFYVARCRKAKEKGEPITLQKHHDYVVDIQVRDQHTFFVLVTHTGPQSCNCKRIPDIEI